MPSYSSLVFINIDIENALGEDDQMNKFSHIYPLCGIPTNTVDQIRGLL